MKHFLFTFFCLGLLHSVWAQPNIIPKPSQILTGKGEWTLKAKTKVGAPEDAKWSHVADMLASQLSKATGQMDIKTAKGKGDITLVVSSDASLGEEGYRLLSTRPKVSRFRRKLRRVHSMACRLCCKCCLQKYSAR
jgi:hexosaminidase